MNLRNAHMAEAASFQVTGAYHVAKAQAEARAASVAYAKQAVQRRAAWSNLITSSVVAGVAAFVVTAALIVLHVI